MATVSEDQIATFSEFYIAQEYSEQNPTEKVNLIEYYNKTEVICEICFFLCGAKHGEYKWFYPNGNSHVRCSYKHGYKHGECKWFYTNGNSHVHCFYRDGKKHGEYKRFYLDGTLHEHYFYIDDVVQPQHQHLLTERCEVTLALLFGENYEIIQRQRRNETIFEEKSN